MESLRERGIYKRRIELIKYHSIRITYVLAEPVFGSTLSEICTREKTFVPKFIMEVTSMIEQKGIDLDGFVII